MERRCKPRRNGADRIRPFPEEDHAKAPHHPGTREQKLRMSRARRRMAIVAAAVLSLAFVSLPGYSKAASTDTDEISLELAAIGKRGDVIARAREQTLEILQSENACSAWFRAADPDSTEVFRSLHYEIEDGGPSYIFHMKDGPGTGTFKHPWAARTTEYGGQNSTVGLNSGGAFFSATSPVLEVDSRTTLHWPAGMHRLLVASFWGNSTGGQITTLLHELGHIVGRLPADNDSWDGRSSRNTEEVLRHCKHEIVEAAKASPRSRK
jgi:hypothetical protein